MEKPLRVGLIGSQEMTVGPEHLASFAGNLGAEVLSTHQVVLLMEQAARNAIQGRLPAGTITVGTGVRVRHLAAVPRGSTVRAEARLKKIDGRRLFFRVSAVDGVETVSEGVNVQVMVSQKGFLERVRRKTEQPSGEGTPSGGSV